MNSWIEEARTRGIQESRARWDEHKAVAAAKAKYHAETVTEETVINFLDQFLEPMAIVAKDLASRGYTVEDEGYKYLMVGQHASEQYALIENVRERDRDVYGRAFGRVWTVTTPGGSVLDTVCLFPMINDETHFAKAYYDSVSADGVTIDSPVDMQKAVADLRSMIGSRITTYFSEHPPALKS